MAVRASHERRMHHAGQAQIVDEAASAGQQRGVFDAADAIAEGARRHELTSRL